MSLRTLDAIALVAIAIGSLAMSAEAVIVIAAAGGGEISPWWLLSAPLFVGGSIFGGWVAADLTHDLLRGPR